MTDSHMSVEVHFSLPVQMGRVALVQHENIVTYTVLYNSSGQLSQSQVHDLHDDGQFHNCQSWSFITAHGQF